MMKIISALILIISSLLELSQRINYGVSRAFPNLNPYSGILFLLNALGRVLSEEFSV
jgi:hypothetical protein